MKTIINIKTDKGLKEGAQSVAKKIGMPLGTIVNSFLRQLVRDEEIFFSLKRRVMTPYLESIVEEAINEREADKKKKYYTNPDDMISALNS